MSKYRAFALLAAAVLILAAAVPAAALPEEPARSGFELIVEEQGADRIVTGFTGELPADLQIPEGITVIGEGAFLEQPDLETVVIPDGVRAIESAAFMSCTSLRSAVLPDSLKKLGYGAFCQCEVLESVRIPPHVTEVGMGAFGACSALTEITVPGSVRRLGGSAFGYCTNLRSVTLEPGIQILGAYAFMSCSALEALELPPSLQSIQDGCFRLSGLKSLVIPEGPTYLSRTFEECKSLVSLEIPASVVEIEGYVFSKCNALKSVTYGGTEEAWKQALTYGNSSLGGSVKLTFLNRTPGVAPDGLPQPKPGSGLALEMTAAGETLTGLRAGRPGFCSSVADVAEAFSIPEGASVQIMTAAGEPAAPEQPAATGDVVHLAAADGTTAQAVIVVAGDVTGSGVLDLGQVVRMARALNGSQPLEGPYLQAALLGGGDKVSVSDLVTLAGWLTQNPT